MKPSHRIAHTATLLVLTLGLVACGDDSSSATDGDGTGPAEEATSSSTTTSVPEEVALCEVLGEGLFEVRRAALAEAEPPVVEAAGDECGSDVRRVEAAVEVMETAHGLSPDHFELSFPDGCAVSGDVFQTRLAVRALDAPVSGMRNLGVAGAVRLVRSGDEVAGSVGEFFDFGDLTAGSQHPTWTQIAGRVPAGAGADTTGLTCRLSANAYYDAGGSADAALGQPHDPAQAGSDPAIWFPALVEAERSWRAADDVSLASTTIDIRHPGYLDVVDGTAPDIDPFQGEVAPCFVSNMRGEKAEVTYAATVDGRTSVHYVVLRQGSDGAWRRLIDPALLGTDVGCDALGFLYQHRTHEPLG